MPSKVHSMVIKLCFSKPVTAAVARHEIDDTFGGAVHFTSNECPAETFRMAAKPKPLPKPRPDPIVAEMLAALEAADEVLTAEDGCDLSPLLGSHNPNEHAAGLVRAAIAKAKGGRDAV